MNVALLIYPLGETPLTAVPGFADYSSTTSHCAESVHLRPLAKSAQACRRRAPVAAASSGTVNTAR